MSLKQHNSIVFCFNLMKTKMGISKYCKNVAKNISQASSLTSQKLNKVLHFFKSVNLIICFCLRFCLPIANFKETNR
jgi:predicted transcriptional regulator